MIDRSRHYLHRAHAVITPSPYPEPPHSARSCREQSDMPVEQSLDSERSVIATDGIERHFYNAVHSPIRWCKRSDVDPKPARNRRSHLFPVQSLSLDLA